MNLTTIASTLLSGEKLWRNRIAQEFLDFQLQDFLTDVTLVCADGKLRAHKLVLRSFSNFLGELFRGLEEDSFLFLPEMSVADVSCFVRCVYSGCLPSSSRDLQAVVIVSQLINQVPGLKREMQDSTMILQADNQQKSTNLEDLSSKSRIADSPELSMGNSSSDTAESKLKKASALNMTKEERLMKSAENLEKLCKFCLDPVVSHRVSLKVKQEKNNSYHLKNQYVCCACGFVLNAPSNFLAHNNNEFSKCEAAGQFPALWQFNCNLCTKTICEHQSITKSDQSFVCCHCQEEFGSPGVLTIHLKTIQTLNLVECDICHVAVPASQVKKHKVKKHAEILEKINSMKAVNENMSGLNEAEKGLDACSECPKYVKATKKVKMAHFKQHHPEYYSVLLKHNNEVWKSAPSSQYIFCDICNKSIRKCNLKDHKFHSHGVDLDNQAIDRPQFTCDICGHVSKYAKDVKKHKKFVHERILNFSCKFCGKKFSNKGNLNQHEVIHTGVTPFQCHVCGRQCRRKSELEKHIQTHTNLHPDIIKLDHLEPLTTDSEHNTVTAIVSSQRMSSIINGSSHLSQLGPIPVGVPGSAPQAGPRTDPGLHTTMSRSDTGVHLIRETQQTVLSGGQQVPLIMTHIDPESIRQADLLKDVTGQHSNSTSQTIKMPTFILH